MRNKKEKIKKRKFFFYFFGFLFSSCSVYGEHIYKKRGYPLHQLPSGNVKERCDVTKIQKTRKLRSVEEERKEKSVSEAKSRKESREEKIKTFGCCMLLHRCLLV